MSYYIFSCSNCGKSSHEDVKEIYTNYCPECCLETTWEKIAVVEDD